MSRRKQSNPKSLKENEDSEMAELTESTKKNNNEWENSTPKENTTNGTDQSGPIYSVTSSNQQVVARVSDSPLNEGNLRETEIFPSNSNNIEKERASPSMSTPDSGKRSQNCFSFAEMPKAFAADLSSVAIKSPAISPSSDQSKADKTHKEEPPLKRGASASPLSSPSPSNSPKVGGEVRFPHLMTPQSLAESVAASALATSLLNSSLESSSQLTNMLQGLPLLSSVLPSLQGLAPGALSGSLSSLSSMCGSGGGILCVCGVKFNSTTNLEAHKLFYCSHRQVNSESRNERKEPSSSTDSEEGPTSPSGNRALKCPHCSYTTTHKLSLNGHMNIHTNPDDSPAQSSTKSALGPSTADPRAQERYCVDCDIQFSSLKTFRVHKTHYCQTRHVLKGSKSPPIREDCAGSGIPGLGNVSVASSSINTQPILALSTNPVLLLPYSLVAGAQLLPPHILPQLGAAFVLPNGQVHPIPSASTSQQLSSNISSTSVPPLLSPTAMAAATAALFSSNNNRDSISNSTASSYSPIKADSTESQEKTVREGITSGTKKRSGGESPLDLTTKRPKLYIKTDLLSDEEEKENRITMNSVESSTSVFKVGSDGKVLLSPPIGRSSRSSNADGDEGSVKSPRSTSTTPKISSPRGNPDSPVKPSTSTLINSRSPGLGSPGASNSSQNLSAHLRFPSHLVSSLESLGNAFPLASLQCLQSLQNVPHELALKLINPELLLNGVPPVMTPPVIVKQGEAKCEECNIVFYKEESLQIHKKHYCSARDSKNSNDSDKQNKSPNASVSESSTLTSVAPLRSAREGSSSTSHIVNNKETGAKTPKTLLQFICTACGIKFSSPDNLSAHQTYYCPKREGANDEGASKGVWRCPRCRVVMAETLQAAHQCVTPAPSPSHGWKCPCCPVLSPTAAAAQKHLETHAGIKAFRCRICGYRGNTLRGMRTHIRMHFEKRTNDLQEENFIACILEDDDQRSRTNNTNSEAQARQLLDSTRILLENSAFSAFLNDASASDNNSESLTLSCAYCPFVTSVRTTLLQHLAIVHKIGLESVLTRELKNLIAAQFHGEEGVSSISSNASNIDNESPKDNPENDISKNSESVTPIPSIKLEPEVKLEIQERDEERGELIDEISKSSSSLQNGSTLNGKCYCNVCNISFSMPDSYIAHKRLYCSRSSSETPPETAVQ